MADISGTTISISGDSNDTNLMIHSTSGSITDGDASAAAAAAASVVDASGFAFAALASQSAAADSATATATSATAAASSATAGASSATAAASSATAGATSATAAATSATAGATSATAAASSATAGASSATAGASSATAAASSATAGATSATAAASSATAGATSATAAATSATAGATSATAAATTAAAMVTPYEYAANGRIMAPLKCPPVASDISNLDFMFKSGTCYPYVNSSDDYKTVRSAIERLLLGDTMDASNTALMAADVGKFADSLKAYTNQDFGRTSPYVNGPPFDTSGIVNDFDNYFDIAFGSICCCYSGPTYPCCLPSINCNLAMAWQGGMGAYWAGGVGDASGVNNSANPSFFMQSGGAGIPVFAGGPGGPAKSTLDMSGGILLDNNIPGISFPLGMFLDNVQFANGSTVAGTISVTGVKTVEGGSTPLTTLQQAYIKMVTAICDNEFKTDANGMPRWFLPSKKVDIKERLRTGKMTGNYEDYALLKQCSERCSGSDWCTPNDSFLDWVGCTYPMTDASGGITRDVSNVEASTLPLTVSVVDILENFDHVIYLGIACLCAETFCYWELKSGTGTNALYKLSPTKPANLSITATGTSTARYITGPGLLQDQSGSIITRLPALYTQSSSPRFCCDNKGWIYPLINLNSAAQLRNICGMQNSLYVNQAIQIPIANVGTIQDNSNNLMDLGPYLVLYGLFSELGYAFLYSMFGGSEYTTVLNAGSAVYNPTNTLTEIQGNTVYNLMATPRAHQLNHINLLKNGMEYSVDPSNVFSSN